MTTLHAPIDSMSSALNGVNTRSLSRYSNNVYRETWESALSTASKSSATDRSPRNLTQQTHPLETVNVSGQDVWKNAVATRLQKMLFEAGYAKRSQEAAVDFFCTYIVSWLGLASRATGEPLWKSLMTDDFSPIEYSWVWSSAPRIRYSVELIGPNTGCAADPFNQVATLALVNRLKTCERHIDWTLFDLLLPIFKRRDVQSTSRRTKQQSDPSTLFLAFEPWDGITHAKAYFLPAHACEQDSFEMMDEVLTTLHNAGLSSPAHKAFRDFMIPKPAKPRLSSFCIAIDCVEPTKSRLKFYVRSTGTSFDTVKDVLRMSNTSTVWTDDLMSQLKLLWSHETAGVLYYFDIHPSNPVPVPKIYLPVKHYGLNDSSIFKGLATFLERRGEGKLLTNFRRILQEVSGGRSLESNRGTQTYISCAVKSGTLELTSYLSPELYKSFT